jgi:hypothetical protein
VGPEAAYAALGTDFKGTEDREDCEERKAMRAVRAGCTDARADVLLELDSKLEMVSLFLGQPVPRLHASHPAPHNQTLPACPLSTNFHSCSLSPPAPSQHSTNNDGKAPDSAELDLHRRLPHRGTVNLRLNQLWGHPRRTHIALDRPQ